MNLLSSLFQLLWSFYMNRLRKLLSVDMPLLFDMKRGPYIKQIWLNRHAYTQKTNTVESP